MISSRIKQIIKATGKEGRKEIGAICPTCGDPLSMNEMKNESVKNTT